MITKSKLQNLTSKKIHASWHLTIAAWGILMGAVAILILDPRYVTGFEWLIAGLILIFTVLSKRRAVLLPMVLTGGVFIGLWRGANLAIELEGYQHYLDSRVAVKGRVADDTAYGPEGDQRLQLSDVSIEDRDLPGTIWISTADRTKIKRGDIVSLNGQLSSGFGNLSASMHQAELSDIERPYPGDLARRMRDKFVEFINRIMPDEQAALGSSFLFGQRSLLAEDLNHKLRLLGLTHLVVASGFHLTVIIREFKRRLSEMSKYLAMTTSFVIIAGFLLLTGFSTSMTRASLVAGLSLLAWYWGRVIHPVVLLSIVAAVTLLIDPSFIWADAGWFLSFAAFAGVTIVAPLLHSYFWGDNPPGTVRRISIDTTAATITTFPIVAYTFGQFSPLSLLSNLLVLPAVPIAMVFTAVGGLAAIVSTQLAQIVSLPAFVLLSYVGLVADWLSTSPLAYGEVEIRLAGVGIFYALLTIIVFQLWRKTGLDYRRTNPID